MTCREIIEMTLSDYLEMEHSLDGLPDIKLEAISSRIIAALIEKSDLVAMQIMIDKGLDVSVSPSPSYIQHVAKGTRVTFNMPDTSIKKYHLLAYRVDKDHFKKIHNG